MKIEDMSNKELPDNGKSSPSLSDFSICDLQKEIADLTEKVKKLENEAEVTNDDLYVSFMTYYELNRWTPESGFEKPIDFYIHEIWKRDPKVAALAAENADLKRQVKGLKYTIRLSYGWLRDYSNDSDNATHAKRILQNEIFGWLSGDTTKEERQ